MNADAMQSYEPAFGGGLLSLPYPQATASR